MPKSVEAGMQDRGAGSARPVWLMAALAAACAITAFRISTSMVQVLSVVAPSWGNVYLWVSPWSLEIGLVAGLLLATVATTCQHLVLEKRSYPANYAVLAILVLLAVSPLQLTMGVNRSLVPATQPMAGASAVASAQPVHFACRLLDAEGRATGEPFITEKNITRAEVQEDDGHATYGVRITLDPEGRRRVSEMTELAVGGEVGYYLDEQLVSRVGVSEPVSVDVLFIPLRVGQEQAATIAARLTAKRKNVP